MPSKVTILSCVTGVFERNRAVRFVMIGGINTAFNYCLLALLLFFGLGVEVSTLVALMVCVCVSFYTQGTVVFGHVSKGAFGRFVAAWAIIYVLNVLLIRSLMALNMSSYLAAALAMLPITVASYFIQKVAVFRVAAHAGSTGRRAC